MNGNAALHYATMKGSSQIARMLIDKGGSTLVFNKKGYTPMHACIRSDDIVCFKYVFGETEREREP